jgi:hypothetical protein
MAKAPYLLACWVLPVVVLPLCLLKLSLHCACAAAAWPLKHTTCLQELFRRLASLSYLGDVRMGLAEDSKKVERIVAGSYDGFKQMYLPLLQVRTRSVRCLPCAVHLYCNAWVRLYVL